MKQFFIHYEKWEDFQSGMYRLNYELNRDQFVIDAIWLLKNQPEFYSAMNELIEKWPIASKVNLTNNSQNKRAWLGAAACCYKHNTPEYLTRVAWNLLNKEDQDKANISAEKIISGFNLNFQSNGQTVLEY